MADEREVLFSLSILVGYGYRFYSLVFGLEGEISWVSRSLSADIVGV